MLTILLLNNQMFLQGITGRVPDCTTCVCPITSITCMAESHFQKEYNIMPNVSIQSLKYII